MPSKRKSEHGSTPISGASPPSNKRLRAENSSKYQSGRGFTPRREKPAVDPTYGQTSAIPGLDDVDNDDEDEEDDEGGTKAALRYLRTVRSEARGIPNLLVAPKPSATNGTDSDEGIEDPRGYYEDGAYVAAPVLGPVKPQGWHGHSNGDEGANDQEFAEISSMSPEAAYTRRILAIFETQRTALRSHKSDGTYSEDLGYRNTYKSFVAMYHRFAPNPDRLIVLQQHIILQMLKAAIRDLKRRRNVAKRYSEWIWGLLCALGDVYTLDSDAVSIVRELGKKAVWVGIGYIGADEADATAAYEANEDADDKDTEDETFDDDQGDDNEQSSEGIDKIVLSVALQQSIVDNKQLPRNYIQGRRRNTSSPEPPNEEIQSLAQGSVVVETTHSNADVEAARDRLLNKIASDTLTSPENEVQGLSYKGQDCPDSNTRATIDMIITIAGEMYGQRDLMEFRSVWEGLWG
jgi:hypothetical protein